MKSKVTARRSCKVRQSLLLAAVFLAPVLPAKSQIQLPDGNGKELVQKVCTLCHDLDRLSTVNFSRADWKDLVDQMVIYGAPLSKENITVVSDYLAKSFPGSGMPVGVVIRGPIEARINEVRVPNGQRPGESLYASDASVWFTAGRGLGRYDPRTGEFKRYPFKNPKSGAHSLAEDREGNVWFTATSAGYVGKLEPKTGEITEYRLPEPVASKYHLHDITVDQKGTVWFTVDDGNMVGRLTPRTGEMKLATTPTPNSNPYEIQVNSKGVPFFTEFYKNRLGSIDPETMEIREYELPNPGIRPKRLGFTADDVIWYDDYGRGYLGRFDPKTGAFKEWPSPGGRKSQPYGFTMVGDIVWYVEGNTKPVTVVRFDTKTEKFQTWLMPTMGERVHDIVHTPEGNVWLGRNSVNGGVLDMVEVKNGSR